MRFHEVVMIMLAAALTEAQGQVLYQKAIRYCYQVFNLDSTPAVITTKAVDKSFDSMSLCLRINIVDWYKFINVVETANFKIVLDSFSNFVGRLIVSGVKHEFDLYEVMSVSPSSWNSICLSYERTERSWMVAVNGHRVLWVGVFGRPTFANTTKVSVGASGFNGYITDVNAWSRALTLNEMIDFAFGNLTQSVSPELISWDRGPNVTFSRNCPQMVMVDTNRIAINNAALLPYEMFLYAFLRNATEAPGKCTRLNGEMYYPNDRDYLKWINRRYSLSISSICEGKILVPFMKARNEADLWVFIDKWNTNRKADLGSWPVNTSLSAGICMYFDMSQEMYYAVGCNDVMASFCALCILERRRLIYRLRSPCESEWHNNDKLDTYYVLIERRGTSDYLLFGENQRSIIYKPLGGQWQMNATDYRENQSTVAVLEGPRSKDPIGLNYFYAETCSESYPIVKISNCYDREFGCPDGECIAMSKRCDGIADCIENFDEMNCTMVSFNTDLYHKEQPPLNHEGNYSKISISLEINVGNINEMENILQLNIFVHLEWYDWRLTYINLKDGLNVLSKEDSTKLWIPKVFFENDLKKTYIKNEVLSAVKVRKVKSSDIKFNFQRFEHEEYDGSQSALVFENSYELKLNCELELHYYPFDTQQCFIQFAAALQEQDKIQLDIKDVIFKGPQTLKQFSVGKSTVMEQKEHHKIVVAVNFKRIFSYHLTNTYLPTLSLLMITEVTLFFDETQMEFAVGFTLTIMLVMYTMYQSINDSLTKTAYLKMIDFWLLFCLLLPLTIFMLEVFQILQKNKRKQRVDPCQGISNRKQCLTSKAVKILVPTGSLIFVLSYFFAAWMIATSNDGNNTLASIQ